MTPLDKLIIFAGVTVLAVALPPAVMGSLGMLVYGLLCCGLGLLLMVAADAYEASAKPPLG